MRRKPDAKKVMLPHSKAKLDFYQSYLERYLPILRLAEFTTAINIFDVFCGTGIYQDGTKGSPIRAFEAIRGSSEHHENRSLTPVSLIVNDIEEKKINGVRTYLDARNNGVCTLDYKNLDANDFLGEISRIISKQSTKERNLILIDPYGYKGIKKEYIEGLLRNKRNTEIILFLPISQIYRFSGKVLTEDDTNVKALKEFIDSFFSIRSHPIYTKKMTHEKELIEYVRVALTFNDTFFATSYFIQRDNKEHYYGLFSIMPNIYGLEKNLEVKWKLSEESGEGFEQPKLMSGFFDDHFKEEAKRKKYNELKELLLNYIDEKGSITNNELYEFTLKNMFLPKHSNLVLKQLLSDKVIDAKDEISGEKAKGFYQKYEYYKKGTIKVRITKT